MVSGTSWGRVVGGIDEASWTNGAVTRTVLVVVHTVTAMNRLADILGVFDSDPRVQLVYTFPDASTVTGDIERGLADVGALVLPWHAATGRRFDLAISVHHSGNLHRLDASLALLSHGLGYTKFGNQEPGTRNQEPRTKNARVYGLGPPWLLRDGEVFADAIILSHKEQLTRLADATPAALDRATVAGDPCFDRLRASRAHRPAYRKALGAHDDQTVVLVSSTWGRGSLFGRFPELPGELAAELTHDDHLVAVVLHPNVWFAHGPLQIRHWLGDALRSGVRVVPPHRGWQQAILAADVVLGDHGAVTGYAAAIGVPTMLATFPEDEVADGTAISLLGARASRLDHDRPFPGQLHDTIRHHDPVVAQHIEELTSSEPDRAADLLRATFYRLMNLTEPPRPPIVEPYSPTALRPEHRPVTALWADCAWHGTTAVVRRWPADATARRGRGPHTGEPHLVVHHDHPRRDLRDNAAVVMTDDLTRHPSARVAVAPAAGGTYRLNSHDGQELTVSISDGEPTAFASAAYTWLTEHGSWHDFPPTVTVHTGPVHQPGAQPHAPRKRPHPAQPDSPTQPHPPTHAPTPAPPPPPAPPPAGQTVVTVTRQ